MSYIVNFGREFNVDYLKVRDTQMRCKRWEGHMNTITNDIDTITINSTRYQLLYKQYIQSINSLEKIYNARELETIEEFILFLSTHTRMRKIERVGKNQLVLFAKYRMKNNEEHTTESILREVVKTLTALKRLHRLNLDVSLRNYQFWREVLS